MGSTQKNKVMVMKKRIMAVMIFFSIALGGILIWIYISADRKAPVITIEGSDITYEEDMDEMKLLERVTASDDRDGDVSDSLVVDAVYKSKKSVTVIYAAKDKANNIEKRKRVLKYSEMKEEKMEENTEEVIPEDEGEAQDNLEIPPGQTEQDVAAIPEEQQMALDALQPQQPKLYLTQYEVRLSPGSGFDGLSFVKDIVDDADSFEELSKRIQINGNADTNVEGTYEIEYLVVDTQGNSSNTAKLTVIVQ